MWVSQSQIRHSTRASVAHAQSQMKRRRYPTIDSFVPQPFYEHISGASSDTLVEGLSNNRSMSMVPVKQKVCTHIRALASAKKPKTYNSGYSLVVTHLTTNPPVRCLNRAERTGSLVFNVLWSYVKETSVNCHYSVRFRLPSLYDAIYKREKGLTTKIQRLTQQACSCAHTSS
jgi:hypothetical protein